MRLVHSAVAGDDEVLVRGDAGYVITGGFGGLGLEVARWLVERGARHLALIGRSEPTPEAQVAIAELRDREAQVEVVLADAADHERLGAAWSRLKETMPPLAGVVASAAPDSCRRTAAALALEPEDASRGGLTRVG